MDEYEIFSQEADSEELETASVLQTNQKYLLFQSGGLLFGVVADYVVEIITNHTVTHLPLVPDYVKGIINLRGQIIPIVDIRLLLGQSDENADCIIILKIDEMMVGILVDTVQRMIDLDQQKILPSPSSERRKLVSGMCSLPDGQTMLAFDCAQLLGVSY